MFDEARYRDYLEAFNTPDHDRLKLLRCAEYIPPQG